MGVREFIADKWARLKAWARSVPPDVWIGLAIGFVTLLVIWMTYKKTSSSNGVSTSTDNPIVGDTSSSPLSVIPTSNTSTPISQAIPDLTQWWTQNSSNGPIVTSPHAIEGDSTTGYMSTLNQNETNGQNAVIAAIAKAAAATQAYMQAASPRDETQIAQSIQPALAPAPIVSQAPIGISGALPGDTRTEIRAAAPAPAPIPITQHYTILSSPAYAPIKAAKNDVGIY